MWPEYECAKVLPNFLFLFAIRFFCEKKTWNGKWTKRKFSLFFFVRWIFFLNRSGKFSLLIPKLEFSFIDFSWDSMNNFTPKYVRTLHVTWIVDIQSFLSHRFLFSLCKNKKAKQGTKKNKKKEKFEASFFSQRLIINKTFTISADWLQMPCASYNQQNFRHLRRLDCEAWKKS